MAINESVLDIISGKAMVDTSTQLLDNTLATINMKMKKKEQQQLATLRSQQIQQASMELAELEKGAYNRNLKLQLEENRNAFMLENQQDMLEMEKDKARFEYIGAKEEAFNDIMDRLISAPDNATQKKYLQEHANELPPNVVEEFGKGNWDDPVYRRQTSEAWSKNQDYMRESMLQREKAQYDALTGSGRKPTYSNNVSAITSYLNKSLGVGGENVAAGIAAASIELKDRLINEGYRGEMPMVIAEKAANLYNNNKEKYQTEGNWFSDDKVDMTKLMNDVYVDMTGQGTSSNDVEDKRPWRKYGVSDADWEATRNDPVNKKYSDKQLLETWAKDRGYL